ncbi:MAG: GNAT family N-acetyltransferase [Clostridiales bacterium]|nr:GNAT family N-acetyltransferase [Clostridiales bacterium]
MSLSIERYTGNFDDLGSFIDRTFEAYAEKNGISCNYRDFCFIAKDGALTAGLVIGHSYYGSVYISDLIVTEEYRKRGIGTMLMKRVEDEFRGKGMEYISLTTFAFQAPEFYKKLGYEVEFIRESKNPKLNKYFLIKYDI